ncbi:malate/lactate/ureidoglycolate dehydrogenase, partial [Klebsiella pneumoniae]
AEIILALQTIVSPGSWQAICAAARDVGLSESHFDRCRPLA